MVFFICVVSTTLLADICDNIENLEKLTADYLDTIKNLSSTLKTTPNTRMVNLDVNNVEAIASASNVLATKCKSNGYLDEDKEAKNIFSKIKEEDTNLQKMGNFDNGALNTARINAIAKSNGLMGLLLNFDKDGVDKEKDDSDEDPDDDDVDADDSLDEDAAPPDDDDLDDSEVGDDSLEEDDEE